jgi:aquaglyceroporin related protein
MHATDTDGERPNCNRYHTAASTMHRLRTANDSVRLPEQLERQRTDKKQEQTIPIENGYYDLNPWHDQTPEKPVFGLAQPLPRTVRPGMTWGRRDLRDQLYQVEDKKGVNETERRWGRENALEDAANEEVQRARESRSTGADREWSSDFNEDYFSNPQAREGLEEATPTFHVPVSHDEEEARSPPERFLTNVNGQPRVIRRVDPEEADQVLRERSVQGGDRGIDEHGLRLPESRVARPKDRGTFGLQDGLPPLQEVRSSASHVSLQTMKEKDEIQDREEQALREYYDTYRNPLARFRAKYPQALAEFLAVCLTRLPKKGLLHLFSMLTLLYRL